MTNRGSAYNAWSKIKNKLVRPEGEGTTTTTPVKKAQTPRKTPAKKNIGVDGDDADEVEATPTKKTPRKRAAKKQDVDGEASPKKRRGKKAADKVVEDDEAGGK